MYDPRKINGGTTIESRESISLRRYIACIIVYSINTIIRGATLFIRRPFYLLLFFLFYNIPPIRRTNWVE